MGTESRKSKVERRKLIGAINNDIAIAREAMVRATATSSQIGLQEVPQIFSDIHGILVRLSDLVAVEAFKRGMRSSIANRKSQIGNGRKGK